MFDKLLIANRGEIACRVIRTARRLGIATVAVYSDADANARHVRLADEALRIGPPPVRESYLAAEAILDAARRSGAQAVHPGYGFLSENADFAAACAAAGVVFVGPPPAAIRAMGRKAEAKALMERAGVPLTPGYHGADQDPARLAREAAGIGWPVLIKASAGGGGKGMRRVDRAEDFAAALAGCQREAASAFGDDAVLVEKYVLRPRHIEVQVFADAQGGCVHLFERDCSVQRRHQKVLEEAPAPGMTTERRAAMGRAAVDAARAVGYVGAGTVEFIVQPDGRFFFMEMNTRLQVEHPVTEMVTGLDLVEWQLRVAAGEPLPLAQEALALQGHAIEARLYAEDPQREFLPSTGRLLHLDWPSESAHVRIDSGVEAGDEVTPHYDPMLAKLVVWGEDRRQALARLRQALAELRLVGVAHNAEFLARLVATPAFAEADLDTGLIERERALLFPAERHAPPEAWLIAAAAEWLGDEARRHAGREPHSPWARLDGWRLNAPAQRALMLRHGEQRRSVALEFDAGGALRALSLDGERPVDARAEPAPDGALRLQLGDRRLRAHVVASGERRHVFFEGRAWPLALVDTVHVGGEGEDPRGGLLAPMPGKVIAWLAEPGASVAAGAPLLVMEAMKMEHTLTAPRPGRVRGFRFAPGEAVADGAELVDFEADGEAATS